MFWETVRRTWGFVLLAAIVAAPVGYLLAEQQIDARERERLGTYYVVEGDGVWDIWGRDFTQVPSKFHFMHVQHSTSARVELVVRLLNSHAVAE